MFDKPLIRVCLILGSLFTAFFVLRRVRQAKVQIEDTIFWLAAAVVLLGMFPGVLDPLMEGIVGPIFQG